MKAPLATLLCCVLAGTLSAATPPKHPAGGHQAVAPAAHDSTWRIGPAAPSGLD
jgi:hypothetical protein